MKFIVAVCLLAFAAAYVSADCGELERVKVKLQWAKAFGTGEHRAEFGLKLWRSLTREHDELVKVFERVNGKNVFSPEFAAHSARVLSGLDMTITMLDKPSDLAAHLVHLKGQHDERNLKPEYFKWFVNHLVDDILGDILETHLDKDAWHSCLDLIVAGIQG